MIVRYEFKKAHASPYLSSCGRPECKCEWLRWKLVAVRLQLCKRRILDRLMDETLVVIQLHSTLDLKGRGIRRVACDAAEKYPLPVCCNPVVDNLSTGERRVSVEDLCRGGRLVCDGPVVVDRVGEHANDGIRRVRPAVKD